MVVGAAFIAAPAIGFFVVFVQPGDDWFVRVNGQEIRRSVLVELLRAEQIEAAQQGRPFDLAARSFDLAAELTEGEVLDQLAGQFGGPPSEEAIEAARAECQLELSALPPLDWVFRELLPEKPEMAALPW